MNIYIYITQFTCADTETHTVCIIVLHAPFDLNIHAIFNRMENLLDISVFAFENVSFFDRLEILSTILCNLFGFPN